MADRMVGLAPESEVTAAEMLQKAWPPHVGVQPMPDGTPGRVKAADVGIADGPATRFFVIGDHGPIKSPRPAYAVSYAMQDAMSTKPPAKFVNSVGDIVYFNGDAKEYSPQFYETYAHLQVPFIAIPGNHDGDTTDDASRRPLDTFMANFCSSKPEIPTADPDLEYGRHTQTLPYCDWTLDLEAVTIIGLYSNVPSGGHLTSMQVTWLGGELKAAAADKPVIVQLHHPPYSVDAHHGGSKKMGDAIDKASTDAGRHPNLVLSGHVHNYQRFTRTIDAKTVTYVVIGNSGYHNLHKLATDAQPGMDLGNGVVYEEGDDTGWGFLEVDVADGQINCSYTGVEPGVSPDGSDTQIHDDQDTFTA